MQWKKCFRLVNGLAHKKTASKFSQKRFIGSTPVKMHFECLYFVDTKTANFIYAYILYLVMLSDSALNAAMLSVISLSVTMLCCYIDNAERHYGESRFAE